MRPIALSAFLVIVASGSLALGGSSVPMNRWVRVPLEAPAGRRGATVRCRSLEAADVDADGVPDLVAACDGTETGLVVWRGNLAWLVPLDGAVRTAPLGPPEPLRRAPVPAPPAMAGADPDSTAAALRRLADDGYLDGPPEAAVGIRLNGDAIPDLAVIDSGDDVPAVYVTAPLATFVVDTTADTPDASPGDGQCRDAAGHCSLRAAITEANLTLGADTITFNVGTGVPQILVTGSALPVVAQPLTIDGATGGATRVDLKRNGTFTGDGLRLSNGASNSAIRGLVLEGFSGAGIQINTSSNAVENCWVGVDSAGTGNGPGNTGGGVTLGTSAANNTIGGATVAQRNVIAHNGAYQVHLQSSGNTVQGNYVGTDVTGLQDITSPQADGIVADSPSGTTAIGGPAATPGSPPGNLVSGNSYGVRVRGGSGVVVQGNLIGPGADGTTLVGNATDVGLEEGTSGNTIGGATASARNVISASQNSGVLIGSGPTAATAASNVVEGNWIGTDRDGTGCLQNSGDGVYVQDNAQDNVIGGSASSPGEPPGNLIACNGYNGVRISGTASTGNLIEGNVLGSDPAHPGLSGNAFHGVYLIDDPASIPPTDGPSSTTVGGLPSGPGACDGPCNRIAGNGGSGIRVERDASLSNAFVGNAIAGNAGLGIDLGAEGVTPNDPGDADAGANGLLNFPTISSVQFDGASTTVQGSYAGAASATFTIDFYANPSGRDPSGYGEGEAWIGSQSVTTDPSGSAGFAFTVAGDRPYVSATARDAAGNTSELSGVFVNPGEAANNDLFASKGAGSSLSISYTPACGASDHVAYEGSSTGALSGIDWTAAFCGLGTSGTASFDPGTPGPGQLFYFVIVGRSASREGSYGTGTGGERPEAVGVGACDLPQALTSACR